MTTASIDPRVVVADDAMAGVIGDDVVDAEIVSRGAVLRRQAAEKAKAAATATGAAAKRHGESLARRYWRGLRSLPADFDSFWNDLPGVDDINECEPGKREQAKASHEKALARNRSIVVGTVIGSLAWCTSGWTVLGGRVEASVLIAAMTTAAWWLVAAVVIPAAVDLVIAVKVKGAAGAPRAVLAAILGGLVLTLGWRVNGDRFAGDGVAAAVVAVLGLWLLHVLATAVVCYVVAKGKHRHGWAWPLSLALPLLVAVLALVLHLVVGIGAGWLALAWFLAASVRVLIAGADGNFTGKDEERPVARLDAPVTADPNESNVVKALAKAVRVKADVAAEHVAVIGVPAADGPWTVTRFQLTDRVFADLEKGTQPAPMQVLAGALRSPTSWVYAERTGDDESQGLLYVARNNPWPTEPTVWPGLQRLEQDVWLPVEYGVDMIKGTPFLMPIAQTSDAGGGSPGSGKTALTRLELCVAAGDPNCEIDISDLKDDGALSMFQPRCTSYIAGDEDEQIGELADWIDWVRSEGMPSRKRRLKELVEAGRAPDAKLTRELSRDPESGLRLRVSIFDEIQDGIAHRKHGKRIADGLTYMAKQGRSCGWRVKVRSQKWTASSLPTDITSVLPTRFAGHCDDYATSAAILGSARLRADLMPPVQGLFYVSASGDGTAFRGTAKVITHYVDVEHAREYVRRVMAHQHPAGVAEHAAPAEPEIPRVLLELQRLLSEPSREGRMLTVEVAAAMKAYGIVEVTEADRTGAKTDAQILQEKVAALLRPFGVLSRPDKAAGNRAAYWLRREHRELGDVGVDAAVARLRSGRPTGLRGGFPGASRGASEGVPGRPNLRVV